MQNFQICLNLIINNHIKIEMEPCGSVLYITGSDKAVIQTGSDKQGDTKAVTLVYIEIDSGERYRLW